MIRKGHQSLNASSGTNTPLVIGTVTTPSEESEGVSTFKEHALVLSEKLKHRASFQKARINTTAQLHAHSVGLSKEYQERGQVKAGIYKKYIQAASKIGFIMFVLTSVAQQAASVLATITLRYWGEHNREVGDNRDVFKYLVFYGAFALLSSLLSALSAILMWVYCAVRSARNLHDMVIIFQLTLRVLNLF